MCQEAWAISETGAENTQDVRGLAERPLGLRQAVDTAQIFDDACQVNVPLAGVTPDTLQESLTSADLLRHDLQPTLSHARFHLWAW